MFTSIKTGNPDKLKAYTEVKNALKGAKKDDKVNGKRAQKIATILGGPGKPAVHEITSIHPGVSAAKIAGLVTKCENAMLAKEKKVTSNPSGYVAHWSYKPKAKVWNCTIMTVKAAGVDSGSNMNVNYNPKDNKFGTILRGVYNGTAGRALQANKPQCVGVQKEATGVTGKAIRDAKAGLISDINTKPGRLLTGTFSSNGGGAWVKASEYSVYCTVENNAMSVCYRGGNQGPPS